jgi:hypothetical protein
MFEPGHLHHSNTIASDDVPAFSLDLFYEVHQGTREGAMLQMCLSGEVAGEAFEERFELHRDTAFNFASVVSRLAQKHGVPVSHSLIMPGHAEFDLMFEDIRQKLGIHSGDAVNFDHLQQDGF